MIGGCLTSGKYNMTGRVYKKTTEQNSKTGQVKAAYHLYNEVPMIARGLANLRGKDSGTEQDWGNKLDDYHYLRVKTQYKMDEGDIITRIMDADGKFYLDSEIQFVVIGVTPTYEPFGSFMEYDIICNMAEVMVRLESEVVITETQEFTSDSNALAFSETSQVVIT